MIGAEIRAMQRECIINFLADQDFTGNVLDFGCGTAPYREIVEASGVWHGYNRGVYPGGSKEDIGPSEPLEQTWDVVLCTQMLQYVPDVPRLLADFRACSKRLVLTVATNWPEVETEDLYRFTRTGMTSALHKAGWKLKEARQLGAVPFGDRERCALGYGFVCEGVVGT